MQRISAALILLAATWPDLAMAQVIKPVPAAGALGPSLTMSTNGTPIVTINTPSAAGVSRNQYNAFDVGKTGLILNNSNTVTSTTLGGTIGANHNLSASGSASVILNEVTGSNRSQLSGYTEVAGSAAQVILANPYGISCSGCGFLNSSRVTLTTGAPVFSASGAISAYNVTQGDITIDGTGMDATRVTTLDLFARAINLNAGIWANDINLAYGTASVDAASGNVTGIANTTTQPVFGLDVAALGGMYARSIRLVGTEAGLGVNVSGTLASLDNDFTLTSNGNVVVSGQVYAAGNLNLNISGNADVSGTLYAGGDVGLTTSGAIASAGLVGAGGNVALQSSRLNISGSVAAGLASDGTLSGTGTLISTSSGNTTISGQTLASGATAINASDIALTGSTKGSTVALSANSGSISNTGQVLASSGALNVSTPASLINSGAMQGNGVTLNAAAITNDQGSVVSSGDLAAISSGTLSNAGGVLQGTGAVTVKAGVIDLGMDGQLLAGGNLVATAGSINASAGSVTNAGGSLSLTASGDATLGGTVQSGGTATIAANGLTNSGTIRAGHDTNVTVTDAISNTGTIGAQGDLNLNAASLISSGNLAAGLNVDGSLGSSGNLTSTTSGATIISGNVLAGGSLSISGAPTTLHGASIQAGTINLNITSGNFDNSGTIAATNALDLTIAGSLTNSGTIQSGAAATVSAASLDNTGGKILGLGTAPLNLTITGALISDGGTIGSNGDTVLKAGSLDLGTSGSLTSGQALSVITASGGISAGANTTVAAGTTLTLTSAAGILLGGTTQSGGDTTILTNTLTNSGTLYAGGEQNITAAGAMTNRGTIGANGNAIIQAASLDTSSGGHITAGGTLNVTASGGDIAAANGGLIAATGVLSLTASGNIDASHGGVIQSSVAATVTAGGLNTSGGLLAADTVTANVGNLTNNGGQILSLGTGAANIAATGTLNNNGGSIASNGQSLSVSGGSIRNQGGIIEQANAGILSVSAAGLLDNSAGGQIATNGAATLIGGGISNAGGKIVSTGDAIITATDASQSLINDNGTILVGLPGSGPQVSSNLTLKAAGALSNSGGAIEASNGVSLTAGSVSNSGAILAYGANGLNANVSGTLANGTGSIGAATSLTINAGALTSSVGGKISTTSGNIGLTLGSLTNAGAITSGGNLIVSVSGDINNNGGTLSAVHALTIDPTSLENRGGLVTAGAEGLNVTVSGLIDNSNNGQIGAAGSATLSAGSLNNQGGVVASGAGSNLGLTISGSLDNSNGGTLSSGNALNLNAGSLGNSSGAIAAAQDATIITGGITNTGGNIVANRDINLSYASLTGVGAITAARNLGISTSGSFDNAAGTTLAAAGNLTVSAGGDVTNEGTLTSGNITTVSGNTVTNTGAIFGSQVVVNAGASITNSGSSAVIAGVNDLGLYASGGIVNSGGGYLYSLGTLEIAGGGGQGSASSLLNSSANIESGGDMSIAAGTITNQRAVFTYIASDQSGAAAISYTAAPDYPTGDSVGGDYDMVHSPDTHYVGNIYESNPAWGTSVTFYNLVYSETVTQTTITGDSAQGQILSGGNLNLNAGAINNTVSTISADGNLAINSSAAINNTALDITQTVDDEGVYHYGKEHGSDHDITLNTYPSSPYSSVATTVVGHVASIIAANGGVSITAQSINNQNLGGGGAASKTVGGPQHSVLSGSSSTTAVASSSTGSLSVLAPGSTGTGVTGSATSGSAIFKVPTGGLFVPVNTPGSQYLVAINSAFPSNPNSVSSTLFLAALGYDPTKVEQRLGDGQYEEQLVAQQLTELTGTSRLARYSSSDTEYAALLTNGAEYAKQYNLALGVALTAEQMATLTTDMVILVSQTVQTASGPQQVLVPVVYLASADATNMSSGGALIAGNTINLRATDALTNSGVIRATSGAAIAVGGDILNTGLINAGAVGIVTAGNNLSNIGGTITGGNLAVAAGNNLTVTSTTVDGRNPTDYTTTIANVGTISATGALGLAAGNALTLNGASISSGGDMTIAAKDINLGTVLTTTRNGTYYTANTATNIGTTITAGGNATLLAANDLTATAANVSAGGTLTAAAGHNVVLNAAIDTSNLDQYHSPSDHTVTHTVSFDQTVKGTTFSGAQGVTVAAGLSDPTGSLTVAASNVTSANGNVTLSAAKDINITSVGEEHDSTVTTTHTSSGFLSSSRTSTTDTVNTNTQMASTISGNTVTIASGGDTNVLGSNVAATNGLTMAAGGNITIAAATDTDHEEHDYSHSQSGLFSSGGIGITIGSAKNSSTDTIDATAAAASTVGSANGNVVIAANDNVHITGSNVIAGSGNVAIVGQDVTIDAAKQTYNETQTYKASSSGLSIGLTGGIVSAGEGIAHAVTAATDSKDGRVQALQGISVGANAVSTGIMAANSAKDLSAGNTDLAGQDSGVQLSISIGGSSASQTATTTNTTAAGSTIFGNNVIIGATGSGSNGALNVVGSTVAAANDAILAGNTINLAAAENTTTTTSKSSSSSGSLGVSIGSSGFTVNAAIAGSKGNGTTDSTSHANTVVAAGNTALLASTGDMTISGAQVSANQIIVGVGGNLNITSLQDTQTQTYHEQNAGAGVAIPIGGAGIGGFSVSAQSSTANSNYASVTTPSGLLAGDDGFQVSVNGNTNLAGGFITSSQQAANDNANSLTTGTLTISGISNSANYHATTIGGSFGSNPLADILGAASLIPQNATGNQASITTGGVTQNVSASSVTITNPTEQQAASGQSAAQVVASLDATSAGLTTGNAQARTNALTANPDVADIAATQQQINASIQDGAQALADTASLAISTAKYGAEDARYADDLALSNCSDASSCDQSALEADRDHQQNIIDQANSLEAELLLRRQDQIGSGLLADAGVGLQSAFGFLGGGGSHTSGRGTSDGSSASQGANPELLLQNPGATPPAITEDGKASVTSGDASSPRNVTTPGAPATTGSASNTGSNSQSTEQVAVSVPYNPNTSSSFDPRDFIPDSNAFQWLPDSQCVDVSHCGIGAATRESSLTARDLLYGGFGGAGPFSISQSQGTEAKIAVLGAALGAIAAPAALAALDETAIAALARCGVTCVRTYLAGAGLAAALGGNVPTSSSVGSAARQLIYSREAPIAEEFPRLAGINPGFGNVAGTTTNCVSCVNAFMARMAGELDAVAKPGPTQFAKEVQVWGFKGVSSVEDATQEITALGNGAYGAALIKQPGMVDHVIGYLVRNGSVVFVDAQSGTVVKLANGVQVEIGESIK